MKKPYGYFTHFLAGLVVCTWTNLGAQDWPQWRGPNRNAHVTGFNAPTTWPDKLTRKWKVEVGTSDSTPALVGDRLYVFSRQNDEEIVRCLNATDGSEIWKSQYQSGAAEGPARRHPGPRSSPTVAEGKVVTYGVRGILSCFDADTGELVWRKDDFPGDWPRFFTSSSPLVVNGMCIAQLGKAENGGVVAYDLNSGKENWRWTGDGPAYASPVLLAAGGTEMIVAETNSKVVGLAVNTGELLWETTFTAQGRSYNAATPIVDGSRLILCSSGQGTTAAKLEEQGNSFVLEQLWNEKDNSVQFNTPVLKDNLLYGLSQRGDLFCKDATTGNTLWIHETNERGGFGSIVDAGSVMVALGPSAELVFFEPARESFHQLASYKVSDTETYAHPVLSGNRVFIEDQNSVTLWIVE